MASLLLICAFAFLAVLYYYYRKFSKKYEYFKVKGIPYLQPQFFYGNTRDVHKKKKCSAEFYRDVYKKFKNMGVKYGGIYESSTPTFVPIDPEIIRAVLVKDFTHFSAHNPKYPGLFFNNLFHMDGEEWKDMRRKLTPTFTSGKMKMMFDILLQKSNGLVNLVGEMCKTGEPAEMKGLLARYTTDVIGNCAFGIECNSLEDVNSEFYQQGQNVFKTHGKTSRLKMVLIFMGLAKFKLPDFSHIENFFSDVVEKTVKYREDNKIVRKDFMHLMIQLKNKGAVTELTDENADVFEKTVTKEVMSIEDISGQCILFFSAGFETSSTTMSYALLELTQNQEVQKKMREEIREVLKRHQGKLTYDVLQEMTYCDNVIHETLRKYPPVATLPRLCTKTYTIPGTDSVIEKGTRTNIPVWAVHMDPDYFPNPHKFDPDRFKPENKSQIKPFTYMPFGEGPRICIGLRFGFMQSKIGLVALINKYNFTLNEKTPYPPQYDKSSFIISVEGGIWLNATEVPL